MRRSCLALADTTGQIGRSPLPRELPRGIRCGSLPTQGTRGDRRRPGNPVGSSGFRLSRSRPR